MEVPMPSGATALSWESCPQELLWIILKHCSFKCLLTCMTVNRRWKVIVLDYIEFYSLWPKIILETVNKGRTFQRKSVLDIKDMLVNSMLWRFLPLAKIELRHTYALKNITSIQVYKEKLILSADGRTDTLIRYFNITNTELTASFNVTAKTIDIRENEYMLVNFEHALRAYGKQNPDDEASGYLMFVMNDILLFRLEDNVCYMITKRYIIWALTWDRKNWDLKSRGRYYGSAYDTVCDMNVYNDRVCLVTKLGFIYCEDTEALSYYRVNRHNLVPRLQNSTVLVLFNERGVAVSVSNSNQRVKVCQELNSNLIWLECEDMTCATEHGEVLFIGYKDGTVAICTPCTMPLTDGQLDRLFNVQDFDKSIAEPSVLAVEVFEDKMSHHLLVATRHKVLQLLITYPDHIRDYYE